MGYSISVISGAGQPATPAMYADGRSSYRYCTVLYRYVHPELQGFDRGKTTLSRSWDFLSSCRRHCDAEILTGVYHPHLSRPFPCPVLSPPARRQPFGAALRCSTDMRSISMGRFCCIRRGVRNVRSRVGGFWCVVANQARFPGVVAQRAQRWGGAEVSGLCGVPRNGVKDLAILFALYIASSRIYFLGLMDSRVPKELKPPRRA